MHTAVDAVRAVLVPFLILTGTALGCLVIYVIVRHAARDAAERRRERRRARCRPLVDALLHDPDRAAALARLRAIPRADRTILTALLLAPLRTLKGPITDRVRAAAEVLHLVRDWDAALADRRWWIRAEAAQALGLVGHRASSARLIDALDDPSEEVRAAAVEALGRLGDPAAIPALVARLPRQSRHQRVRIVEALQQFGLAAADALLAHAAGHPDDVAAAAELLGSIEAPHAADQLREWSCHHEPDVRAAAVRALGAIGVDDRTYYHVLRTLGDGDAEVRAAAAWALGRSGRADAAAYLAPRLRDEWSVAAESARALRRLGDDGRRVLEAAAAADGNELARQALWERAAAGAGV